MRFKLALGLVLISSMLLANETGPFKKQSFDEAVKQAASDNKLVFVDFYADWCGPCKMMDRKTFVDPEVQAWLKENAVSVKVDVEQAQKLALKYKIEALPSLLFLDGNGKEVSRMIGFYPPGQFLQEARKTVK